jgi:hypothetical protein
MDGLFLWCVVVPLGLAMWLGAAALAVMVIELIREVF